MNVNPVLASDRTWLPQSQLRPRKEGRFHFLSIQACLSTANRVWGSVRTHSRLCLSKGTYIANPAHVLALGHRCVLTGLAWLVASSSALIVAIRLVCELSKRRHIRLACYRHRRSVALLLHTRPSGRTSWLCFALP